MGISILNSRKTWWIGALLVVLLVTGCAGIEPYEPRNNREEGPEKGLFTGSEGEFVIFRKADEPKTGDEMDKASGESEDGESQKKATEQKKQ
jgi:hypothetical protein